MTILEELGKLEANKNVIPSDCMTFSEAASYVIEYTDSEYNRLFEAVGIEELAVYESTGSQIIYEAGKLEEFKNKVVAFIQRVWQAIKDFFTRIIGYIMLKTKSAAKLKGVTKADVEKYAAEKKYGVASEWKQDLENIKGATSTLKRRIGDAKTSIEAVANNQLNDDGTFKDGKDASSLANAAKEATDAVEKATFKLFVDGDIADIAAFKKAYKAKYVAEKPVEVDKKWLVDNIEDLVKEITDKKLANDAKAVYNDVKGVVEEAIKSVKEGWKDGKMAMVGNYATKAIGTIMKIAQAISGIFGDLLRKKFTESLVLVVRAANAIEAGKKKAEKEAKKEDKKEEKAEEKKEEKKEEKTNESVDLTASFIDEAFNW